MAKRGCARNGALTPSLELNQHQPFDLPKLRAEVDLASVWFRVERQALVVLPETGEILFGIRLEVVSVARFRENRKTLDGLLEALKTMPKEIADYDNLTPARQRPITQQRPVPVWLRIVYPSRNNAIQPRPPSKHRSGNPWRFQWLR